MLSLEREGRSRIPYDGLGGVWRLERSGLLLRLSSSELEVGSGDEEVNMSDSRTMEIGREGSALVGAGPLGPGRVRERSR